MRGLLLAVGLVAIGCQRSAPQGEIGGHCYPNGTCNVTLACVGGICVAEPIDARVQRDTPPTDAPVDAAFACADDSAFEPNNTISTAYQTPVAINRKNVSYASLAICPATDKDFYRVDLTATQNIEAIVTYQDPTKPGAGPLTMSIDNSSSVHLVDATPVVAMPNTIRAYAANLPMSSSPYYIEIESNGLVENNYQLDINVTP
jgi:hypothetical protein